MGRKLPVALEVARAVINSLGTGDTGYLITFHKVPQVRVPYTYDVASLGRNLLFSPAHGKTALYDAVKLGLDHGRKGGEARKALIVISDGGDNRSRLHGAPATTSRPDLAVIKDPSAQPDAFWLLAPRRSLFAIAQASLPQP